MRVQEREISEMIKFMDSIPGAKSQGGLGIYKHRICHHGEDCRFFQWLFQIMVQV